MNPEAQEETAPRREEKVARQLEACNRIAARLVLTEDHTDGDGDGHPVRQQLDTSHSTFGTLIPSTQPMNNNNGEQCR